MTNLRNLNVNGLTTNQQSTLKGGAATLPVLPTLPNFPSDKAAKPVLPTLPILPTLPTH